MTEAHLPRAPAVPGSHRSSPGDHGGGLGSRRTVPGQQGVRGRNSRGGKGVIDREEALGYVVTSALHMPLLSAEWARVL